MRRVIVDLNGHTIHEARIAAARFLERTDRHDEATPRKFERPPGVAKLERARTRILKAGTIRMRKAILDALGTMRSQVLERAHIREAGIGDIVAKIMSAIEFLSPQALVAAIAEIQSELVQSGLDSASTEVGFTWDAPPQQAMDALYATTLAFARNVVDREKVALKLALLEGLNAGDTIPEMAARIKDVFEDGMHIVGPDNQVTRVIPEDSWAEMVARTETTRAMSAGIMVTYHAAAVSKVQWLAAEDEATCFPAGTLIETPAGPVPIERISAGGEVLTPDGPRAVYDTRSRAYEGGWCVIETKQRKLISTATHPVWTDRGWRPAFDVDAGDLVQSASDELCEVQRACYFVLSKADDAPPTGREQRFFAEVRALDAFEAVPIVAVDLKADAMLNQGEVDGMPAERRVLLLECDTHDLKGFPELSFEPILAAEGAITAKAAKLPIVGPGGAHAEDSSACVTCFDNRRPAADLGAIAALRIGGEALSTPRAFFVDGSGQAAGSRAYGIAIRGGRWDGEDLPAGWTGLVDALAFVRTAEAFSAKRTSFTGARAKTVFSGEMSAFELRSTLLADADDRHTSIIDRLLSQRTNQVYNLEVQGNHVYFASGMLVHNCVICSDADGETTDLGTLFAIVDVDSPPAHPSCRCVVVSVQDGAAAA